MKDKLSNVLEKLLKEKQREVNDLVQSITKMKSDKVKYQSDINVLYAKKAKLDEFLAGKVEELSVGVKRQEASLEGKLTHVEEEIKEVARLQAEVRALNAEAKKLNNEAQKDSAYAATKKADVVELGKKLRGIKEYLSKEMDSL